MNFFEQVWGQITRQPRLRRLAYRLKRFIRREPKYLLDVGLIEPLREIAERHNRRPDELALAILNDVLKDYEGQKENQICWQTLSPREQQVAALICMHHTTAEIADLLKIKDTTVLTYVNHIFEKFEISSRKQLQARLSGWDFSRWVESKQAGGEKER